MTNEPDLLLLHKRRPHLHRRITMGCIMMEARDLRRFRSCHSVRFRDSLCISLDISEIFTDGDAPRLVWLFEMIYYFFINASTFLGMLVSVHHGLIDRGTRSSKQRKFPLRNTFRHIFNAGSHTLTTCPRAEIRDTALALAKRQPSQILLRKVMAVEGNETMDKD